MTTTWHFDGVTIESTDDIRSLIIDFLKGGPPKGSDKPDGAAWLFALFEAHREEELGRSLARGFLSLVGHPEPTIARSAVGFFKTYQVVATLTALGEAAIKHREALAAMDDPATGGSLLGTLVDVIIMSESRKEEVQRIVHTIGQMEAFKFPLLPYLAEFDAPFLALHIEDYLPQSSSVRTKWFEKLLVYIATDADTLEALVTKVVDRVPEAIAELRHAMTTASVIPPLLRESILMELDTHLPRPMLT